jgi:hypothetical protein
MKRLERCLLMIETQDFRFRDDMFNKNTKDTVPIEILIPPYKGVILRYTEVGIKEQDNGTAVMRFAYDLLNPGDYSELTLRRDERFEQHIGLLLNHLILEAAEFENNESGKDDLTESSNE